MFNDLILKRLFIRQFSFEGDMILSVILRNCQNIHMLCRIGVQEGARLECGRSWVRAPVGSNQRL